MLQAQGTSLFFGVGVVIDSFKPTRNLLSIDQDGPHFFFFKIISFVFIIIIIIIIMYTLVITLMMLLI
jgi:hypothetical protein